MPTKRIRFGGSTAIITHQEGWKPGDLPPTEKSDYLGWHAWAEVQHKAGLRQQQCGDCGGWFYPQELSDKRKEWTAHKRRGQPVKVIAPLCKACEAAA